MQTGGSPRTGSSSNHPQGAVTVDGNGLVLPGPGGDKAPLALAFLRYLQGTFQRFLGAQSALPASHAQAFRATAAIVARAHARSAKAVLGCFASPTVGTPLQTLALRGAIPDFAARIDEAAATIVPHLLLELSIRRLLSPAEHVDVPGAAPLATLVAGVRITPPARAKALRFSSGTLSALDDGATTLAMVALTPEGLAEAPRSPAPDAFSVERVWHRAGKVTRLGLCDHNPIAQFEAHPDKHGNPVGLGEKDLAEWLRILDEAFAIIERHQPALFAEMGVLLHELIPVGYDRERHLSCSYREAIGTVYLTLHDNVMTMAEAIVHEFQHNKINCAAYSADFLANAFEPLYKSPVRPDPRPLWGILLAVHAFLPVADLYRRMRDAGHEYAARPDWVRRMGDIDLRNHEGMEMLRAHARWLPAGSALFDQLDAFDRHHVAERAAGGLETRPTDAHVG
jgi:HEXXH motif-containing protein